MDLCLDKDAPPFEQDLALTKTIGPTDAREGRVRMPPALNELSASMLSAVHDAATTGLVVSVTLAALFALAATATTGERDRRQELALLSLIHI